MVRAKYPIIWANIVSYDESMLQKNFGQAFIFQDTV